MKATEEQKSRMKDYYRRNKDKFRRHNRKYHQENQEKLLIYKREWYASNSEKEKSRKKLIEHSVEVLARGEVRKAISRGDITRGSCQVCGEENAQGHHEDYTKPLDVLWLCDTHHKRLHGGQSVAEMMTEHHLGI